MRKDPGPRRPPVVAVRTADPDEAREVCGENLYPRTMRLFEPGARLDARFSFMHLRSLTVGDVRYGAAITGVTEEIGSYHTNVPVSGRFWASQGGRPIDGNPGHAAVYRPYGRIDLHYAGADCHFYALRVDKSALEGTLSALLDVPVRDTIRLSASIDATAPAGRTYLGLVRLLAGEIGNPGTLYGEPLVAAPFEEALLTALLLAADHQHRDALQRRAPWRHAPRSIVPAVDAVHAEPQRPFTVEMLAGIAGITSRQLRIGFQRQFGRTPMAYVRDARLMAAHAELVEGDPGATSVAEVARRWGFPQVGRFTARYVECFHERPEETLRR